MACDGPRPDHGPIFDTPLTPYEAELLDNLIEECAEVIHASIKLRRFGRRPQHEGKQYDNVADLSREAGQLTFMLSICESEGFIEREARREGFAEKERKLPLFTRPDKL